MSATRAGDSNRMTREYFDELLLEMRHIDAPLPDTHLTLFGETFDTPVMMAALSHLDDCHPGGMAEMARGAKAAGAVMWAGMGDEAELERIVATGARTIKIVKPYEDEARILRKLRHAESVGCLAVGMDIDHQYTGKGERDVIHGLPMMGKTIGDIGRYAAATKLPFILKGVLSVQDARKCLDAGVRGIVVSHHHGILDYAVPPLMVLPEIAEAVRGQMEIFVDCGVMSGYDVFKALALGATAVSAGRVIMGPLAERGAEGVADLVREMTAQLAGAMARTASASVDGIDPTVLRRR